MYATGIQAMPNTIPFFVFKFRYSLEAFEKRIQHFYIRQSKSQLDWLKHCSSRTSANKLRTQWGQSQWETRMRQKFNYKWVPRTSIQELRTRMIRYDSALSINLRNDVQKRRSNVCRRNRPHCMLYRPTKPGHDFTLLPTDLPSSWKKSVKPQ